MPKYTLVRLFTLLALCTGLALTGCDSNDSDNDTASIGGTYTATATMDGMTGTFELAFPNVDSGSFTLSGTFAFVQEGVTVSVPITGDGTYDFPDISMNLMATVAGTTDSSPVSGTVSSSADIMTLTDEDGETLTFRRQ